MVENQKVGDTHLCSGYVPPLFLQCTYGANIPFVASYLLDALKICTLKQSLEDTKVVEAKDKCPCFYNYFISSFFIIG